MSNVQEALITKFQEAREMLKDKPYGSDDFNMFRAGYEAALSELEKCEPVAYIHKHYLNEDKDSLDWHKREHPQFKMIPLYKSPVNKD